MKEVYNFLLNKIKLNKEDIIVVGVSAGPDSMALLYILEDIRKKIPFKIIVAHINHNLRKESEEEASFLKDYCMSHNIIFEYMKIEEYGDDNFHNEARNIRYRFYDEQITKYHANYLMTGHHGDDLMETILMRLTRGSTLRGYSGFSSIIKKDNYQIIRPLIFVTKEQLEQFDIKNNIPYRIDKSNYKDKYTRNRYRKVVLPFLKEEDPFVHQKFLKFSNMLEEYSDFFDKLITLEKDRVYKDGIIDVSIMRNLEPIIQKGIIEYIYRNIYEDDLIMIDTRHIDLMLQAINSSKEHLSFNLPNDYLIEKNGNNVYLRKEIKAIMPYDIELNDEVFLPNGMTIKKITESLKDGNDIMRINSKDISLPLRVRTRKQGDKMTIKNFSGTKKVSDILINSKVPKRERDSWPIVVDSKDTIIWIPKIKKSKYNRLKDEKCDIIFKCL